MYVLRMKTFSLKKEQIKELKAFFTEHTSGWEISKFNSKTKD